MSVIKTKNIPQYAEWTSKVSLGWSFTWRTNILMTLPPDLINARNVEKHLPWRETCSTTSSSIKREQVSRHLSKVISLNLFWFLSWDFEKSEISTNQSVSLILIAFETNCTGKWSCSVCEARFHFKAELDKHMTAHIGYEAYPCPECPKKFSTELYLKAHLKTHTFMVLLCKHCGKQVRLN